MPAGFVQPEGIGVLVEHMRRNRVRRGLGAVGKRRDQAAVGLEVQLQNARLRIRGAKSAAFADLGRVPGDARVDAARDRQCGDDRRVGGASRDDDVGPGFQRRVDLLGPGQRNDVGTAFDQVRVDFGRRGQGRDSSRRKRPGQASGGLVGFQNRDLRAFAALVQDLARDLQQPVHGAVRAAGAGRADDQRTSGARAGVDQPGPFGPCRGTRVFRHAPPQIGRTGIGGSPVYGDQVGPVRDAQIQRRLVIAKPKRARGDQDACHLRGAFASVVGAPL